jgi:hypothetical protein
VAASRVTPVPCEVMVTLAPLITEPVLSATVPEKLPVACPYNIGHTNNASEHRNAMKSLFLFNIGPSGRGGGIEWKARIFKS